jgi:4-amino-4-deoxy-L-arabinose transferase-like glycosyltransferase
MDSNNYAVRGDQISATAETPVDNKNRLPLNLYSLLPIAFGAILIIYASLNSHFRDSEGALTGRFCLPLAIGASLILIGGLTRSGWKDFAGWLALAVTGQAVSLQMIDAGRLIHFQHYRSLSELLNKEPLLLVFFATQTVLVALGIGRRLITIKKWLGKTFARWQLLVIALLMFVSGAAVTRDASVYLTSLFVAAFVQFVSLANIVLLIWSVPNESLAWLQKNITRLLGESASEETKKQIGFDRFAWVAALWVVLLAGMLSYFVYERHPHVPDETQYLFQARYMAAGQLTVKAPPVPEAFSMYMIPYQEERWFGIFSPGWPAVLAVGMKLNIVWLINPLLAGLCILLAYIFFQELYSRRFARLAVLLLCCSPWFVFMSMSFMSHIFTLACALSAAILLRKATTNHKTIYALCAGLFIGIVSLIRPLDGAMVAVLLGVWTLLINKTWKTRFIASLLLVIGTIATGALVFPYNKFVTGKATLSPLDAYYTKYLWDKVMALGFGPERGMGWGLDAFPGHSPLEALINTALSTFSLNTELFGWGIGSLLLAVCFLLSGGLQKKDFWILAVIAIVVGGYSLFWYHGGPDFGARYWFLCIIPLIALTIRGAEWLSQKLGEENVASHTNPRVVLALVTLCMSGLICYFPWRAVDKYRHYLGMRPDVQQLAQQHNFGKSLVLIRGNEHPDYQSAWIYNPLNFEGDAPIYAWDKNPEIRTQLLKAFADRPIWIVEGPTMTHGNYKVVQGPIDAQKLLAKENR